MPELLSDRITILTSDGKDHTARNNRASNEFDGAALDALVAEFVENSDYELSDVTAFYVFTESVSEEEQARWQAEKFGVQQLVPLVRSDKFVSTGE